MAISQELQQTLDYYEQLYYSLDEPVPFKEELKIYPVLVKDYYVFYNNLNCLTMDKNIKTIMGEDGRPKKISNPKGIGQNYLEFLIDEMNDKEHGIIITNQVINLFELIFHIQKGLYCPHCGKQIGYSELYSEMDEYVKNSLDEAKKLYNDTINEQEGSEEEVQRDIPKEIVELITKKARSDFFAKNLVCQECGEKMRDVFSIKDNNGIKTFMVKDVELNSNDFDKLKAIVPRQNILDYDGDKYLDYDLKEELELKAQMQNKDYTSPTLEKQLVCVAITTGFNFDYLKNLPMRRLSMMLRLIDRKNTYYAQLQASMSGMVTFKEEPKHWIFSDDKKNIKDELTSIDNFEKKFAQVT